MRAVGILEYGGPDVLEVIDRGIPDPGPGELRIRVAAAAVNPTDLMLRSGLLAAYLSTVEPPYVPGMDVSGTVDAAGAGTLFALGDRVMAFVNPFRPQGGAQAEYVVVSAADTVLVPPGLDLVEAAGLPMNALTAHQALALLALPPGSTLAVTGGAGAVGGFVIQLAAHRGLRVVAEAAPRDEPLLKQLGAETVVPRHPDPTDPGTPGERYRRAVPGGVDALVDAAVLGEPVLDAVRDGGAVVTCRPGALDVPRGIVRHEADVMAYPDKAAALTELAALACEGVLSLRTDSLLTPSAVPEAHRRLAAGGVRGRQLLVFGGRGAAAGS
ncbi:NADP-dependent oxidoreductase [Streptomyces griseoflavus]|uniref:NADP-dependent oxidoreductase n=1 Tax=Streptomyces griseoflavus TaxID=35619 RepID=UPI00167D2215|nr:NADP-dependent oxidoreductase [Streptomyces griseoflavus]GGV48975.1 zinc-binding alcohol dehydrogenase [Streptomyces griseoflavus]